MRTCETKKKDFMKLSLSLIDFFPIVHSQRLINSVFLFFIIIIENEQKSFFLKEIIF